MNDLENIDNYFADRLSAADKLAFEQRIKAEPALAEAVAFYMHTKSIEREKAVLAKHQEWTQKPAAKSVNFTRLVSGIAASLLIVASWWFITQNKSSNIETLAQNYIAKELNTLPIKMDAKEDSLELGKKYYNEAKYSQAQKIFESLAAKDLKAFEFAGLSALKAKDYPTAERAFGKLSENSELIENKGKFYLVLTYFKMGEKQKAESLLLEIKKEGLFGADLLDLGK
jgi:hypothetical protein